MIREVQLSDAKAIADIYNYYIRNTIVTFEEDEVDEGEIKKRLGNQNPNLPYLVYIENGKLIGYAYAMNWRTRVAYRNSVEVSIYLHHQAGGKGIGSTLYQALIDQLVELGYHVIIGGVSLPNEASVKLHEKCGFEKVAHFKEVGYKLNQWVDVGFWEIVIEKNQDRSY